MPSWTGNTFRLFLFAPSVTLRGPFHVSVHGNRVIDQRMSYVVVFVITSRKDLLYYGITLRVKFPASTNLRSMQVRRGDQKTTTVDGRRHKTDSLIFDLCERTVRKHSAILDYRPHSHQRIIHRADSNSSTFEFPTYRYIGSLIFFFFSFFLQTIR